MAAPSPVLVETVLIDTVLIDTIGTTRPGLRPNAAGMSATGGVSAVAVGARAAVLAIVAPALGGFAISTGEFVTLGPLPDIAGGVHATIPSAGHVVVAAGTAVSLTATVFTIAAAASTMVVLLRLRLMEVAGDARMVGAALNHSALNAANALGAWLGGLVLAAGFGFRAPSAVGAGLAVLGPGFLLASAVLRRRELTTA